MEQADVSTGSAFSVLSSISPAALGAGLRPMAKLDFKRLSGADPSTPRRLFIKKISSDLQPWPSATTKRQRFIHDIYPILAAQIRRGDGISRTLQSSRSRLRRLLLGSQWMRIHMALIT